MSEYDFMWPTVDKLCESMENEPHMWEVGNYTFKHKSHSVEYYGSSHSVITDVWTGRTTQQVFSHDQGVKLGKALKELRKHIASDMQEKIMKFGEPLPQKPVGNKNPEIVGGKPWWKFWE